MLFSFHALRDIVVQRHFFPFCGGFHPNTPCEIDRGCQGDDWLMQLSLIDVLMRIKRGELLSFSKASFSLL